MKTIFEKIIDRELPAKIILENHRVIVIQDIHPQAPHHYLIIAKKAIPYVQAISQADLSYMSDMILAVQELAKKFEIENYRLVINNGSGAGQTVFHLHIHFLAGKTMEENFA